jgi:putative membrane protein
MRALTFVSWIAGLALIAALILLADAGEVLRSASLVGWTFVPILLIRVVLLYVDAHSWRWLLRASLRPSVNMAAFQRWIGESVSVLLPFAVIGGELVRVRLAIVFGIPGAPALASIVMDAVVAAVSQMLFVALGIALYAGMTAPGEALTQPILLGGIALALVVVGMWMAVRGGFLGRFGGLLKGMVANDRVSWLAEAMQSVDRHILEIANDRRAFLWSLAWRLLGWLMGAAEVWLILAVLGQPITVTEALMLDALTGAVRTAFFFVPGGLGVQEGALMLLGASLGVGGETMLAVAVVKRAREVALSIPGLLAWQAAETRSIGR